MRQGVASAYAADVQCLVRELEVQLSGFTTDCVLTFGSVARDESILSSDVDLWFIGHGGNTIFLDKTWRHGRYGHTVRAFLDAHAGFSIRDIDSWDVLRARIGVTAPFVFGSPIADTRWLLGQLADEQEWQTFLFVATGESLYDPWFFLSKLKAFLWGTLPFHLHPDHGIVVTLKHLCEAEKLSMLRDLAVLSGKAGASESDAHTTWLWPAVQCIRDSVVLLTLVTEGRPVYRRTDVTSFIARRFPNHLAAATEAYRYKATNDGREAFREIVASGAAVCEQRLLSLTQEVLSFWHIVMSEVDRAILDGRCKIRLASHGWREKNRAAYCGFLETYLQTAAQPTPAEPCIQ